MYCSNGRGGREEEREGGVCESKKLLWHECVCEERVKSVYEDVSGCVWAEESVRRGVKCVCVCDSDSNCSSPLLQKLLAWSALSQSECRHKRGSLWAEERAEQDCLWTNWITFTLSLSHCAQRCDTQHKLAKWSDKNGHFVWFLLPCLSPSSLTTDCGVSLFFSIPLTAPSSSSTALISFALISMFLNLGE